MHWQLYHGGAEWAFAAAIFLKFSFAYFDARRTRHIFHFEQAWLHLEVARLVGRISSRNRQWLSRFLLLLLWPGPGLVLFNQEASKQWFRLQHMLVIVLEGLEVIMLHAFPQHSSFGFACKCPIRTVKPLDCHLSCFLGLFAFHMLLVELILSWFEIRVVTIVRVDPFRIISHTPRFDPICARSQLTILAHKHFDYLPDFRWLVVSLGIL